MEEESKSRVRDLYNQIERLSKERTVLEKKQAETDQMIVEEAERLLNQVQTGLEEGEYVGLFERRVLDRGSPRKYTHAVYRDGIKAVHPEKISSEFEIKHLYGWDVEKEPLSIQEYVKSADVSPIDVSARILDILENGGGETPDFREFDATKYLEP